MERLIIDIIDPKAKKLLEDMEALKLISINNNKAVERIERLLGKIRSVDGIKPTLDEIAKEIEIVRQHHQNQQREANAPVVLALPSTT